MNTYWTSEPKNTWIPKCLELYCSAVFLANKIVAWILLRSIKRVQMHKGFLITRFSKMSLLIIRLNTDGTNRHIVRDPSSSNLEWSSPPPWSGTQPIGTHSLVENKIITNVQYRHKHQSHRLLLELISLVVVCIDSIPQSHPLVPEYLWCL